MNRNARERPDRFQVERSLGNEIRRLRENLNLGLVELAELAGISGGMLSKLESGLVSPSITTLEALARALHQPIGALFRDYDEHSTTIVTRADQGVTFRRTENGRIELLGRHTGVVILQPWLITILKMQGPTPDLPQSGAGFVYVLEGGVEFTCGATQYILSQGDSLLFDATRTNKLTGVNAYPTRLLHIIARPRDSGLSASDCSVQERR